MKKIALVFKYELLNQLRKKTVIVTTAVLMLVIIGISFAFRFDLFGQMTPNRMMEEKSEYPKLEQGVGYVFGDEEIKALYFEKINPPAENIFQSAEELRQAVQEKKVEMGFFVPKIGQVESIYLDREFTNGQSEEMELLSNSILKSSFMHEKNIKSEDIQGFLALQAQMKETILGRDSRSGVFPAFLLMFFVYMVVLIYGNVTATVIAREKDSKTMEILITSCKPSELIIGKVLGSGVAALVQSMMLLLAAVIGYHINSSYMPMMVRIALSGTLSGSYILVFAFFSFIGFLMYLFLYAALGSTVSKVEDVGSGTALVQFLFISGYFIASSGMNNPQGSLLRIGSIIPFTSIMNMPLRSALSSVPAADYLLAGGLLVLFTVLLAFLSIKIYRWGTLNYGNKKGFFYAIKQALKYKG